MPALKNPRHEEAVQHHVKGMSQREAYVAAGHSKRSAYANAARMFNRPAVKARLAELKSRGAARAEATLERWTRELAGIAFADIRDVVTFGPRGVKLRADSTLTPEQAALIAEVSDTKDGQRIKLHPKLDALDKLAKRFGWYEPEQHDHRVVVTKIEYEIVDPKTSGG